MCHYSILELRSRVMHSNTISKVFLWWDSEKRDLPWRISRDPWAILVSEFMLQQTQVKPVIRNFKNFVHKVPSLKALSESNEKKILKLWECLGYYSRAKNLHKTSKILVKKYNSQIPDTYEKLKELPGIGDYTANVLLALVYNQPRIAIDGNCLLYTSDAADE